MPTDVFPHYLPGPLFNKSWCPKVPIGEARVVRQSDDFVVGCRRRREAGPLDPRRIGEVLRRHRHHDIWEVGKWPGLTYEGWLNYYVVPGTIQYLRIFRDRPTRLWMRASPRPARPLRMESTGSHGGNIHSACHHPPPMAGPVVCGRIPETGIGWFNDHIRIVRGEGQCTSLPRRRKNRNLTGGCRNGDGCAPHSVERPALSRVSTGHPRAPRESPQRSRPPWEAHQSITPDSGFDAAVHPSVPVVKAQARPAAVSGFPGGHRGHARPCRLTAAARRPAPRRRSPRRAS